MPAKAKNSSNAQPRRKLIAAIEKERDSKVISYFLADRRPMATHIAEDAVRPMYDHLRALGSVKKIDLFLYSLGGQMEVPWRIVTMIREFAEEVGVLVPYKAMSAATMIALGADEIVMGRKGELGPIDPKMSIQRSKEGQTAVEEEVAVEDIMSYLRFLRDKAGLSDQTALAGPVAKLCETLPPSALGGLNRVHSHIRLIARKLLTARTGQQPLDEQKIQVIIDTLAEKTYQHGHAIGRREAAEIGLNVILPSGGLEENMWRLFEDYEQVMKMRESIDPATFVPAGQDEHVENVTVACIESSALAHHYSGDLKVKIKRQALPQVTLNLNLNLQLPPNVQAQQLPAQAQNAMQKMLEKMQQPIQDIVQQELRKQMPATGYEARIEGGAWRQLPDWSG
jgi:hypothetical protein